jgi:hypothetical protein
MGAYLFAIFVDFFCNSNFAVIVLFVTTTVARCGNCLGPSDSVTCHVTHCGRPRVLNGPCGGYFGIRNDWGLCLKLKGRGMCLGCCLR